MTEDKLGLALEELARREADYQTWRIEQACKAAAMGGQYGVLIRRDGARLLDARPDPSVPFGQIDETRE